MPNIFIFQGWRDIKHALVQLELYPRTLSINNKKAYFHLNRQTFHLTSNNNTFGIAHIYCCGSAVEKTNTGNALLFLL